MKSNGLFTAKLRIILASRNRPRMASRGVLNKGEKGPGAASGSASDRRLEAPKRPWGPNIKSFTFQNESLHLLN